MSTIGVDTGGTFTDLVYLRDDGSIEVAKVPSTPLSFRMASSTLWRRLIRAVTSSARSTISTMGRPSQRTR